MNLIKYMNESLSRLENPKLTIELVPRTAHYKNVRSEVSTEKWDDIRIKVYEKANYKCEICNGVGTKWAVECHEIWHYDDDKKVQTLKGFIALCPPCHKVKHIGLAQVQEKFFDSLIHLMQINKWNKQETENYIAKQFELYQYRSQFKWTLNLDYLNEQTV